MYGSKIHNLSAKISLACQHGGGVWSLACVFVESMPRRSSVNSTHHNLVVFFVMKCSCFNLQWFKLTAGKKYQY